LQYSRENEEHCEDYDVGTIPYNDGSGKQYESVFVLMPRN
jgi:hypothetical protein